LISRNNGSLLKLNAGIIEGMVGFLFLYLVIKIKCLSG